MAEYLLHEGYKDSAAVIAGSTLESHLRALCNKNGIDIKQSLDFQLNSFEFIGKNLKLEVFEKNSQVYILFEEGKQPKLFFEKY